MAIEKKVLVRVSGVVLLVCLFLGAWAFWWEPKSLRVSTDVLSIPKWPQSCHNLTVAVLSDLHVGSPFNGLENLEKIVSTTMQLKPDLILLPGDFVIQGVLGGRFVPPEDAAKVLSALSAPLGVFAVLGNHDWWLDGDRVTRALEENDIPVLEDRAVHISKSGCEFYLVGVGDFWEAPHDIDKALSAVPPFSASILFTHNPDIFPKVPESVTLTIAGHTHGGQVYFPGIGRPVVPSQYGESYAIGHVIEGNKQLFVSSGVGTSILPVRFLVPPEITLISLHSTRMLNRE
ncbi:MAG: metallophosphoesterase [Alcanivoracaceae bacterium]|nr:metallophosphoesterase [Alcanivoracaceae bacterium]